MSSLSALQQCLFELHGISPFADRDAQIAVLFFDIQQLMQSPFATVSAFTVTISAFVETPSPTPIYSNVLSHTVLANPIPSPVLTRVESPLSSYSFAITPMELALIPGPEESALALPVSPSPIHPPVAPAMLGPVHGMFSYFYSYPPVF